MRTLSGVDLNLLIALEALLLERSVPRAAARLGITPPAMSSALARLRELFSDELFVDVSSGMRPTARALELADMVGETLTLVRDALATTHAFDPATARRQFTIGATDHASFPLLPELIGALSGAPHVGVTLKLMRWPEAIGDLEHDRIDIAVGSAGAMPRTIEFRHVRSDRLVCIARRGDIGPQHLTLEDYLGHGHAVRIDGEPEVVDEVLGRIGRRRDVRFAMQNYLAVGLAVASSTALATMPSHAAYALADFLALDVHELPVKIPVLDIGLAWCRHRNVDTGLTWFRDRIVAALETPGLGAAAPVAAGQSQAEARSAPADH